MIVVETALRLVGGRHGDDVFWYENVPKRVSDEMSDSTSKTLFPPPPTYIAAFYRRNDKRILWLIVVYLTLGAVGGRHGDDVFWYENVPKRVSDEMSDSTSRILFPPPPTHIAAFYRRNDKRILWLIVVYLALGAVGGRHGDDVFWYENVPKRVSDEMWVSTSKILFPPPPTHIAAFYRHNDKRI